MTGHVYDVVVIGAGIGGLTAAALGAAEGLDVLVLEGHTRPGGCAGDFVRRRVLFPAGATVVMGFEEGGLHRWVYDRLGLRVFARPRDLAMRVHLPDREVGVHTDRTAWDTERRRAFPETGRGGERFWSRVQQLAAVGHRLAARRPTLPIAGFDDLMQARRLIRPEQLGAVTAIPALWQTVGGLLGRAGIAEDVAHRRFGDNQLLIPMQRLSDECVALSGALALDIYRYGTYDLPAGTATIAHDLEGALKRHGGRVRYGCSARLLERHGDAWAVTTSDDDRIKSQTVIANLTPENVALLLGPSESALLRATPHARPQPWGAAVLFAALDPTGLPGPLPRYHQVVESYDGSLDDGGSCFVSVFGPEPGRDGAPARITVSTHTRVEPWWQLKDRPAYLERKQELSERLVRAAEHAVPDLRARLRFSELATPRSYWRWTGRHEGRVGGVAQTRGTANLRAISHRAGPPGLFLCGDSTFPGQGTIGVTLSGIIAARSAVQYLRRAGRPWWRSLAHLPA
jgi:C-3',4' desaturase CrtD